LISTTAPAGAISKFFPLLVAQSGTRARSRAPSIRKLILQGTPPGNAGTKFQGREVSKLGKKNSELA
jgi:hypothetical protein